MAKYRNVATTESINIRLTGGARVVISQYRFEFYAKRGKVPVSLTWTQLEELLTSLPNGK